jgi:two-component system, OmpR family, phosphate regulon sensor histidine kinase PhoR
MRNLTPKETAFFSSLFTALSVLAVLIALSWFGVVHISPRESVIIALLVLLAGILVTFIFISAAVTRRLEKIVNTIHSFRDKKAHDALFETGKDVIADLDREVHDWAEDRKNEMEQVKKLENYRKEFLGNVSHELKTPIFNIQGYVLTLLEGGLEDETINRDYLQRAEKSIDRMISIIEDLEAISQLETGELEIEPERFDIVRLIKDVFEAQEFRATGKGVILSYEDPEERPIFVNADRFRIRQVLTNLVVNSIKYSKEYGETRVKVSDAGDSVVIEVRDNGIGISGEHLPRLFERFYRVDKSRSREMGGTGLGLAIVKHIIEAHDQTISVMSTLGAGSVFSFTLKKG